MNRNSMRRSRVALPVLLIAAGFGALQGASGCGRAHSSRVDSETHWLTSCDSYLDCGAGSCECGVCTAPCASDADCSVLGFTAVECVPQPGVCGGSVGSTGAASSACLLPCVDDADCSALGSGAVCDSQRCELPASIPADPVGATGSTSAAVLCDGSEDVRFLWVGAASDGISGYPTFAQVRRDGFLAIDGQCHFWSASGATRPVSSGTLSPEQAAAFATAIAYERFADYTPYDDVGDPDCAGYGTTQIWAPASRAQCRCNCSEDPAAVGWLRVLEAMSDLAVQELFANGQTLTGPLRLALVAFPGIMPGDLFTRFYDPVPWPLSRAPAANETYSELDFIDESSGVEITDPGELSALRAARDIYIERDPGPDFTPVLWTDPATQQLTGFHMLLRDELPAHVQAALERPLF